MQRLTIVAGRLRWMAEHVFRKAEQEEMAEVFERAAKILEAAEERDRDI